MTTWARTSLAMAAIGILTAVNLLAALAQPGGTQMLGTVQSFANDTVTLADGSSFAVTETTRVTQLWRATASDLSPGDYVAISAARTMDGALEASVISAFPEAARGTGEGQREMVEIRHCEPLCQPRDLMTNATIDAAVVDAVSGGEITVSFLGETALVRVSPLTRIDRQAVGSLADIVPGATVLGFVNPSGVAPVIWVYPS